MFVVSSKEVLLGALGILSGLFLKEAVFSVFFSNRLYKLRPQHILLGTRILVYADCVRSLVLQAHNRLVVAVLDWRLE